MLQVLVVEHRVPPPTPLCYIASSIINLTKRGVGMQKSSVFDIVSYIVDLNALETFVDHSSGHVRKRLKNEKGALSFFHSFMRA